jgi:DNA-3-methyladenine glycosylase
VTDLDRNLLQLPAWEVAPLLLGSLLIRETAGQQLIGRIVETEAYDQNDAASHSYKGRTPRTDVMFGPAGRAYVYFTYGMHYCFNIVTGPEGHGSAVLIRALEPLQGIDMMMQYRSAHGLGLTDGPAKLCQALLIDKGFNGHNLSVPPLILRTASPLPSGEVVRTTRIGISREQEKAWRFYIRGNDYISKP